MNCEGNWRISVERQAIIKQAQDAISRAQTLIVDQPQDPNAAILELNEAFGLLETVVKS